MLDVSDVQVWATVTPKLSAPSVSGNYTTPGDAMQTFDLNKYSESKTFTGNCTFTQNGDYEVVYYAKDQQGNVVSTPPQVFKVTFQIHQNRVILIMMDV